MKFDYQSCIPLSPLSTGVENPIINLNPSPAFIVKIFEAFFTFSRDFSKMFFLSIKYLLWNLTVKINPPTHPPTLSLGIRYNVNFPFVSFQQIPIVFWGIANWNGTGNVSIKCDLMSWLHDERRRVVSFKSSESFNSVLAWKINEAIIKRLKSLSICFDSSLIED